ncbi:MAG: biliverdin-producing heme oxygenase [Janthinobacterium lividum]
MPAAPLLTSLIPPVLLLPALREGTHHLHERLESRLDLTAHLTSPSDYLTLLKRFYGFYAPLENALAAPKYAAAWADLGIAFEERRKAALLESDLSALGLTAGEIAKLERCPACFEWDSAAELMGCAYVLEGATLGGQVIGRHLERKLGFCPGSPGAQFFSGYGPRNGAMWQQFRRTAEEFAARQSTPQVISDAVAAACRTFSSMEAWLLFDRESVYSCYD